MLGFLSAIGSWIVAAKWYLISGMVVTAFGTVALHLHLDTKRDIELGILKRESVTLRAENNDQAAEISRLNEEKAKANARLAAEVEAERLRTAKAQIQAQAATQQNQRISSELATAKRKLSESNDPTLKTWAIEPVPADAISGVRDAAATN